MYRLVESSVTIEGSGTCSNIPLPEDINPADPSSYTYYVGDYGFELYYENGQITNKLVATTGLTIGKKWSPKLPELAEDAVITVKITRQTDKPGAQKTDYILTQENLGPGSASATIVEGTNTLELRARDDFEFQLINLPRFDEDGYEYDYFATEEPETITVKGADGKEYKYGFQIQFYNNQNGKHETTLHNTMGGGTTLAFDVEKVWHDDGDTLCRDEITLGLFYREPAATRAAARTKMVMSVGMGLDGGSLKSAPDYGEGSVSGITLNDQNQWRGRIIYILPPDVAADDPRMDIENYYLREIRVGDYPTVLDANGNGTVVTDKHHYEVRTVDLGGGDFTFYNTRTGNLTIDLSKTWRIGEYFKDANMSAEFLFSADGVPITAENYGDYFLEDSGFTAESFPITMAYNPSSESIATTTHLTLGKLQKYSKYGAIIEYKLEEIALLYTDENGDNQRISLNGGGASVAYKGETYPFHSSGSKGEYVIGPLHTDDTCSWSFVNQISRSKEYFVNKVWRDDGSASTCALRPDIILRLYRTTNPEEIGDTSRGTLVSDRMWTTTVNTWHWHCSFGQMPEYNENGELYYYYVVEAYAQLNSNYVRSYYNGSDHPNAEGENSRAVFVPMGNAAFANSTDDPLTSGVIINTITGTTDFEGHKLWENIPPDFSMENVPALTVHLLRQGDATEEAEEVAVYDLDPPRTSYYFDRHTVRGANGEITASGEPQWLEYYNPYGTPYKYQLAETVQPGYEPVYGGEVSENSIFDYYVYDSDINTGTITNTYLGGRGVFFSVQKDWNWGLWLDTLVSNSSLHPKVDFILTQYYADGTYFKEIWGTIL